MKKRKKAHAWTLSKTFVRLRLALEPRFPGHPLATHCGLREHNRPIHIPPLLRCGLSPSRHPQSPLPHVRTVPHNGVLQGTEMRGRYIRNHPPARLVARSPPPRYERDRR
ncbi:uncharacterized protein Tco025E_07193 [Trypanosoma conorhini]|uniref:Uncharacterized protein n=1 Tax=Trypanosoma conorhini TaxID=83891 RepID=A0A3R7MM35_9TRYP|nr:uncharacterized protein Tco025E_07193 [Trypanosoma conorhini]RNF08310.1 hypothetical protein Tco025E_07193 [Trypanosoma conorhini]